MECDRPKAVLSPIFYRFYLVTLVDLLEGVDT